MTMTLLRGRLLSFRRAPQSLDDSDSYTYETDGGILVDDGRIAKVFYPVFPPDRNAEEVIAWLQAERR